MSRFLVILEVSQKQAYIFRSNKLKENITNSAVIAYALGEEYIASVLSKEGYSEAENMVYAGGGHTILTFEDREKAQKLTGMLTESVYRDFDGLSVFTKIIEYDEAMTVEENIHNLTKALEEKKSLRKAAFHKGSFGIEKNDSTTLSPTIMNYEDTDEKKKVVRLEYESAESICPKGYRPAYQFENLGGSKNETNFIAVVHIDGNGMGKRVEDLYKSGKIVNNDFDKSRRILREFSAGIDSDYKKAFKEMMEDVSRELDNNKCIREAISLSRVSKNGNDCYFPVRKIITAGDDICFVSEGRIGIECAVSFINRLSQKTNCVDGKNYSACAGVAIVHQKYPFYKAYELAEMLCSNAKSFNATVHPEDNGQSLSSIDWHVEFGEIRDSMDEIRSMYNTMDNGRLCLRPYVINGGDTLQTDIKHNHSYKNFKSRFIDVAEKKDSVSVGKMKELRRALREGEDETSFYLHANLMSGIFPPEYEFVDDYDGIKCSSHFDIIEVLDTYLPFANDEEGK